MTCIQNRTFDEIAIGESASLSRTLSWTDIELFAGHCQLNGLPWLPVTMNGAQGKSDGLPRTAYVSTEAIGDAEGALIGGLMYIGATAVAGAIVATGGTLAAAGRAAPARRVHNANAKNVRNEALLLLSILFLPFRGPRAACSNAGNARRPSHRA